MISALRAFAANSIVNTVTYWLMRVVTMVLISYLAFRTADLFVLLVTTPEAIKELYIATTILLAAFFLFVLPLVKNFFAKQSSPSSIKDIPDNQLLRKPYIKHIPATVPANLFPAIAWYVEASEDQSPDAVKKISELVVAHYNSNNVNKTKAAEILAVHEAAHATVALALGQVVVGIDRKVQEGYTYTVPLRSSSTFEDYWDNTLVTIAGSVAERKFIPDLNRPTDGGHDRAVVEDCINALVYGGWSPSPKVSSTVDALTQEAIREVTSILDDFKDLHADLREKLAKQTSVTTQEIIDLATVHLGRPYARKS